MLCTLKYFTGTLYYRIIFFTGNGQNTTQCPVIWKPYDGKGNMIFISLIVVTLVLAVICIAYLVLLGFEKYLINTHREEQMYVNQIITVWFRHRTDEWNHIDEQPFVFQTIIIDCIEWWSYSWNMHSLLSMTQCFRYNALVLIFNFS